jgi:hypothetical protein
VNLTIVLIRIKALLHSGQNPPLRRYKGSGRSIPGNPPGSFTESFFQGDGGLEQGVQSRGKPGQTKSCGRDPEADSEFGRRLRISQSRELGLAARRLSTVGALLLCNHMVARCEVTVATLLSFVLNR